LIYVNKSDEPAYSFKRREDIARIDLRHEQMLTAVMKITG